ncbi:hypothetical protein PGT21_015215 [Puccinia graminis f. sp. tritici]|uniref:Hydrophobin n=1 Tax=Puccinia graminis f. sp. tritici TaxID=56615 RepID=A0A5B0MEW8_PUCGR|nr:hypothetical protein PGT21_015215 [Puccinia graminis f. sp. tritici]
MHFFKSSVGILAVTCKLALAFDCHSPYGAGGCLYTVLGSGDVLSPALRPNGAGTTFFICQKGLEECCLDTTFNVNSIPLIFPRFCHDSYSLTSILSVFQIPPGRVADPNNCHLG